jgi:phosphate transport system ATP-binding protein
MSENPVQTDPVLEALNLNVRARGKGILQNVSMYVAARQIFGIIGPSGAGKSTLLRCFNRLSDLTPGIEVRGDVRLKGHSMYSAGTDVNALRARVGMLFQEPVVFPTDIRSNVLFGARRLRRFSKADEAALLEASLREAALWEEVRDRLTQPAGNLSVGQQQRVSVARALANRPILLLADEPTATVDPANQDRIIELIARSCEEESVGLLLVTHSDAVASRFSRVERLEKINRVAGVNALAAGVGGVR